MKWFNNYFILLKRSSRIAIYILHTKIHNYNIQRKVRCSLFYFASTRMLKFKKN